MGGTDFLELYGAVSIVADLQGYPGMSFYFQKPQEITRDQIWQVRRVGYHNHVFSGQKLLH
jgi:hypothetical protein